MNSLQPAALAKYIDHTLLAPDASREQIRTLCEEAMEHGFIQCALTPRKCLTPPRA